jgi:excinuclease ABC subunit C
MRRNGPVVTGRLPGTPGVYRFRDARQRVLYIGRASALRSRVASYWSDLRDRDHLAAMVTQIARIEAVSCDSAHQAAWLERNLLESSRPRWNRTLGGQESAVFIRLDMRPAGPGLSVAYRAEPASQARLFGPYLGGGRARMAVSALNRLLPLSYAGDRLAGADRDMARPRGVAGTDRAALIGSLTEILERQPAAVGWARSQLERLRDRAAAELAYEFAARIQDEMGALDWITCPQRVTAVNSVNFTVSGWSEGVLVQFQIRGGRICRWSQRACSSASAARMLAATPANWRDFAQRNAELAAKLAQQPT